MCRASPVVAMSSLYELAADEDRWEGNGSHAIQVAGYVRGASATADSRFDALFYEIAKMG